MIRFTSGPLTPSRRDSLGNAAAAIATATPTTRRLAAHSLSTNTRAAYSCALRQFDTWRGAAPATDATLAASLGFVFEQGRAPATAALVVAGVTFRATLAGTPVRGPQTDRVLAGFRRDGADRGRGQAAPLRADGLAAILATADRPRVTGRGREAGAVAARRGALDKALAAVLFQGGLRRAAAAALEWRDVAPATTAGAIPRHRASLENRPGGTAADVRYLKSGAAAAAAGLHGRLTAHSGRVGLASELTARGASTTDVMLAGAWKNRADGRALQRRGHRGTRRGRALPVAPGETGRQADGRAGRRRGPPPATPPPANKKDALRCARSPLDGVGDARGTGPPDPAGLRHPRLSVWKWQGEKGTLW